MPSKRYILTLLWFFLALLGLFAILSYLRGNKDVARLVQSIAGYTVASYNRLAFLLQGNLTYPYAGSGVYAFRFLTHVPLLHRWIDVGDILGMPDKLAVWFSEFPAVYWAGLNPSYIWSSAFGYVYSDIRFGIFPYFFVIGFVSAALWRQIIQGRTIGVVLYPWFAFSVLFWMGDNFLVYTQFITFTGTALLLASYEHLIKRIFKRRSVSHRHAHYLAREVR